MKILVYNIHPDLIDLGDTIMLLACVEYLHDQWPDAEIVVPVEDLAYFAQLRSAATPLLVSQRRRTLQWQIQRVALHAAHYLPMPLRRLFARFQLRPATTQAQLRAEVASADLTVVHGCGLFSDRAVQLALDALDILEQANQHAKPSAIMSIGVGQVRSPLLGARMARVLPDVTLLGVRESHHAPSILAHFGVTPSPLHIMADDGLTYAYRHSPSEPGDKLGLSLHIHPATTDYRLMRRLAPGLRALFADLRQHGIEPTPIPTFRDGRSLRHYHRLIDPTYNPPQRDLLPRDELDAIRRSRVVISTAYHSAMLALGMGKPVIAIGAGDFSTIRFEGLQITFPDGLTILDAHAPDLMPTLRQSLSDYWQRADDLSPRILAHTEAQIVTSQHAYRLLYDRVMT